MTALLRQISSRAVGRKYRAGREDDQSTQSRQLFLTLRKRRDTYDDQTYFGVTID